MKSLFIISDDTDLSESEAISAAQITSPASAPSETEEDSRDGQSFVPYFLFEKNVVDFKLF